MPRDIPSGLKAHYALGTTSIVQCWRAQLRDGTVIASTTHTEDLEVDGTVYESSHGFTPSNIESTSDLSYDNLEVNGYLASPAINLNDVHSGRWDYAEIILFEVNPNDVDAGINILNSGTLGQVKAGRSIFTAELRGLTQKYARRIVMLTTQECNADLGDSRCKVDLTDWTVFGSVDSVTNNKVISDAARTEPADWFVGGLLTWTTGLNAGQSMEVKSYSPGTIELHESMPFRVNALTSDPGKTEPPAPPDQYTLYAGCQKRFYQDCISKFDNGLNFRGFPHLPGAGVFGGPGTVMTPATVPGSGLHSPPPPPVPGGPPGPAPVPGGTLGGKVLGCYFQGYDDSYPITDVPLDFNVIFLFNARPSGGDGSFAWDPGWTVTADQVQTCRQRGQSVVLTVGGSGFSFPFTTRAQSTNFVNSVKGIISSFGGLDGVDFNTYEGTTATSPSELLWIAQQFKAAYGANFMITSPPQPNSAEDRALLKVLADNNVLTFAAPQYYDWVGFNEPGFISNRTIDWVNDLGQARVALGLSANYPSGPSLSDCTREWSAAVAMFPNLRGAFCWNAQTNIAGGNVWGSTMRALIGSSVAAPPPPPSSSTAGAIPGVVAAPAGSISLASFGAVGDGSTDNVTALNTAIAAAKSAGVPLFVPAGQYNFSSVIDLDGVVLTGAGATSILYATDYQNASIWMQGSGPAIKNLTLDGAPAPSRQADWERTRIAVMGATNFVITNNVIKNAPAASIQTALTSGTTGTAAGNGTITNNTIQDSLSDSIHMTADAHDITVDNNLIERSGDDGIACVSYSTDAGRVHNITARNNVVRDNVSGRGMSVVGGSDVLYQNNTITNSGEFAGLYIAQESSFDTKASLRVTAEFNTLTNCGDAAVTGHAAVMVFSDGGEANDSITVARNVITQSGSQTGIRYFGPQTNVLFDRNQIIGAATDYVGDSDPDVTIIEYTASAPPPSAPPPATGGWGSDSVQLVSPLPERWLQVGPASNATWVADNPWGSAGLTRGAFAGVDGFTFESAFGIGAAPYGANGEVAARFAWKWPNTTTSEHEVKAYPSLLNGKKPGYYSPSNLVDGKQVILPDGSVSNTSPSGATPGTFFPLPANGALPPVNCSSDWHHNITPTGQGHLSFDIWLTDRAQQTSGFGVPPITHEIMIPLDYWGNYGAANNLPGNRNPADFQHDVTINGLLWHVYMHTHFGWTFVAFEPDAPLPNGTPRTLNLSAFVNHVRASGWANGTEWFSSTELGIEPVYGVGDITVTDYRVWRP